MFLLWLAGHLDGGKAGPRKEAKEHSWDCLKQGETRAEPII